MRSLGGRQAPPDVTTKPKGQPHDPPLAVRVRPGALQAAHTPVAASTNEPSGHAAHVEKVAASRPHPAGQLHA